MAAARMALLGGDAIEVACAEAARLIDGAEARARALGRPALAAAVAARAAFVAKVPSLLTSSWLEVA